MKILYRYEFLDSFREPQIVLEEWEVIEELPQSYRLRKRNIPFLYQPKIVRKNAKRPFARPTKEEALESFIRRKEAYLDILEARKTRTEMALRIARAKQEKMDEEGSAKVQ